MFIGREQELKTLEYMGNSNDFRMVVIYGRRRVGKTSLIQEFCKNRRTLSFTATEASDAENLRRFSAAIHKTFGEPDGFGVFPNWDSAFEYIITRIKQDAEHPLTIVFDEFPYAAENYKPLPSVLQIAIDHGFLQTNATMILCGSNEGFMESHVLGYKSPLYGRRNAQIHLKPFTLFDAVKLMPENTGWEDAINYYATLGGTPFYLKQIDPAFDFADNISRLCFNTGGLLYEEPLMLMRQELREPAVYFSVLNAIGSGRNTPKLIAEAVGVASSSVAFYLDRLSDLGIIERNVPFGEKPHISRKGIWRIKDPFFAYWFQFVNPNVQAIENDMANAVARHATAGPVFSTYVGQQFEDMCMQWLTRRESLPFLPTRFGKWWGNDSATRTQADIDIVMDNEQEHRLLLGECKWRNHANESEAINTLHDRRRLIKGEYMSCDYYLFTKEPASEGTRGKTKEDDTLHLVDARMMLGKETKANQRA